MSSLELSSSRSELRRQGPVVAAPRCIELHHNKPVILNEIAEIMLLQNDDVRVVHIRPLKPILIDRIIEIIEVLKISIFEGFLVRMLRIRVAGMVVGFFEEAEVFVFVVVVVVLEVFGDVRGDGREEEESGE